MSTYWRLVNLHFVGILVIVWRIPFLWLLYWLAMEYEKAREVTQSQNYGISLLVSSTLSCMSYGRKLHTNHPVTHAKYSGMKNLMIIPVSSINLVSSMIHCWVEWFKTLFHPISASNLCMKEKGKNTMMLFCKMHCKPGFTSLHLYIPNYKL